MPLDATAWLALGSNVGDREAHLAHAIRGLEAAAHVTGLSSVYETDPIGYQDQGAFLNMVVRLETTLGPAPLLALVRRVEAERGRVRSFRNAPRTLDIDILLYDEVVRDTDDLNIPHPRMTERIFVLAPLVELAPRIVDPRTGRRYSDWLSELVTRRRGPEPADVGERVEPRDLEDLGVRRIMDGEELLGGETR